MAKKLGLALLMWCLILSSSQLTLGADGWKELFNGKNLNGWKVSEENKDTFSVRDGIIVVDGPRAHRTAASALASASRMKRSISTERNKP